MVRNNSFQTYLGEVKKKSSHLLNHEEKSLMNPIRQVDLRTLESLRIWMTQNFQILNFDEREDERQSLSLRQKHQDRKQSQKFSICNSSQVVAQ